MTCEYITQDEGITEKEKGGNQNEYHEVSIDLPVFHETNSKHYGNDKILHRKQKPHSISDCGDCDDSKLESSIFRKVSKRKSSIINGFQQQILAFQEKVVKWMSDISNNLSLPTTSIY
nr:uncharacterized protein LOC124808684 [Hydra vulgaris]